MTDIAQNSGFSCRGVNGKTIDSFVIAEDGRVMGTQQSTSNTSLSTYGGKKAKAATYAQNAASAQSVGPECCKALGFYFDDSKGQCYKSAAQTSSAECAVDMFKVIFNARGNEGAIFDVDANETCHLEVSFEYLIHFDCDDLYGCAYGTTETATVETIDCEEISDKIEDCKTTIKILTEELNTVQKNCEEQKAQNEKDCAAITKKYKDALDRAAQAAAQAAATENEEQAATYAAQANKYAAEANYLKEELQKCEEKSKKTEAECEDQVNTYKKQIEQKVTECEELERELEDCRKAQAEQQALAEQQAAEAAQAQATATQSSIIDIITSLDICTTLEMVEPREGGDNLSYENNQNLVTVYEDQLFKIDNFVQYLNGNCNTGIYFSGNNNCTEIINGIKQELGDDCVVVSGCSFDSQWLTHSYSITDTNTLLQLQNQTLKLGFLVKNSTCDFSILVDKIEINKVCTTLDKTSTYVTKCPSYELERTCDNKKSWVAVDSADTRTFELTHRDTEYSTGHHKLVINSKEVDLDISPASAIETDVWCYINDNSCMLNPCESGFTYSCPAGYELTVNNDDCVVFSSTSATLSGTPFTLVGGNNFSSYNQLGARFYENIDGKELPLTTAGSGNDMLDGTGGTVAVDVFINSGNSFWENSAAGTSNGRLNAAGIWGSGVPDDTWNGFTTCIELEETKTYYVALAADNRCRFSVNGTMYAEFNNSNTRNFNFLHVFPFTLNSGLNIIEMQGWNDGSQAAFVAEIYEPTDFATLTGATTTGDTGLIFSTGELIGGQFLLSDENGYSCPTGYALNNCSGGTPVCTLIDRVGVTVEGCGAPLGCGDTLFNADELLTTELSAITTLKEFETVMCGEFIDAKNRKTLSAYPTLRLVYDRYMESCGNNVCDTDSARFDYETMGNFTDLVGNYWVDLIEQVIPSTTLWGSTYKYKNTIFDKQKFPYKKYSLFTCEDPNAECQVYPMDVIASASTAVITEEISDNNIASSELEQKQLECQEWQVKLKQLDAEYNELKELQNTTTNEIALNNIKLSLENLFNEIVQTQTYAKECEKQLEELASQPIDCISGTTVQECTGVYILDVDYGSEFIGKVSIVGNVNHPDYIACGGDNIIVSEPSKGKTLYE